MAAPGVTILERASQPAITAPTDSGVAFVVAPAPQGPSAPQLIRTLDQLVNVYGARDPLGRLYDWSDVAFRAGLTALYVARVTGAGAAAASRTLKDGSNANTLTVTANGPGTWGNSLSVAVLAGTAGGTYVIQILLSSVEVERSPDLVTVQDAVNWANAGPSRYVTASIPGAAGVPAVAAGAALSGGSDGAAVTDTETVAALAQFPDTLGPGQVAAPGVTSSTVQLALLAHAAANNRFALVDLPDTATVATLTAATAALAGSNARYYIPLAPWLQVQGLAQGATPRIVPPSAATAGIMARTDAAEGADTPAAGLEHVPDGIIGVTQSWPVKSDRDTLNTAGVAIYRTLFGVTTLYGYRTGANPSSQSAYVQASQVRYIMGLKARLGAAAQPFVFRKIDGAGHVFLDLRGALQGVLQADYNNDQLYGATPADAFAVDVSAAVNTPQTIANGELHAVVAVRVTPFAEQVIPELAKIPITVSLAA